MSDKYGECYCGDCISFNKCKSDKGTRINLVSEGCSCFEPNDIAKFDYPILQEWLAEHDARLLDKVMQKWRTVIDEDGVMHKVVLLKDIEKMKAEVSEYANEP